MARAQYDIDMQTPAVTPRPDAAAGGGHCLLLAADHHQWPADPDEVPEWRLRQEERAARIGITLPPYRTRREFEAEVAACVAAQALTALPADELARRFLAAHQTSTPVIYSSEELDEAFVVWCARESIATVPQNTFRAALLRSRGVSKGHRRVKHASRLHRPTVWTLAPLAATSAGRMAA